MGPPNAGDRAQEDEFCDEISRGITRLDQTSARLRTELAKHTAANRAGQIARIQAELRDTAVERRKLIDMLIAIGHSFPCRHSAPEEQGQARDDGTRP